MIDQSTVVARGTGNVAVLIKKTSKSCETIHSYGILQVTVPAFQQACARAWHLGPTGLFKQQGR